MISCSHGSCNAVARHPAVIEATNRIHAAIALGPLPPDPDDGAILSRYRVTMPFQALAERLIAHSMLKHPVEYKIEGHPWAINAAAIATWEAQTYLWSRPVLEALATAPPHPPTKLMRPLMPYPVCFISYECAVPVGAGDGVAPSDWRLMVETDEGLTILFPLAKQGAMKIEASGIPWGTRIPEDIVTDAPGALQALSMAAFLRSPYITTRRAEMPRPMRRQPGHYEIPNPIVAVVTLRSPKVEAAETNEESGRKWKHRWWVAGHYREQFYPATGRHEFVWIVPYVKGPEGLPFLEKVYSVRR